ncbi:hypothetical protein LCM20_00755 [Halobacillus litoralis]|uniref:hypothetical protein n=1 Tax=Halobacillus litoralis TaxID=45668 RepID=UPI001CD45A42|nr:hypothetical protein [Halobacillus litoralis]MCA0969113.1 hypothetical protein [Halobacillus litoralis]
MSWRAVEMQVALPRVQDAGKLQEQIAARNPTLQHFVSQKQEQIDRRKRTSVIEQENVEDALINENETTDTDRASPGKRTLQQDIKLDHPYLGKRIDYSG